jgi:hypothetical protein
MLSDVALIELFRPAAAKILGVDATAIAQVAERKDSFAGLDHQPAATAMANERRAIVATEMRTTIAPELGWTLVEDNLQCGAYEWLAGDVAVRLSKTTRASRMEDAKAQLGIQGSLFETTAAPTGPRDEVLIRLKGNVLKGTKVDVVSVDRHGKLSTSFSLTTIAALETVRIRTVDTPPAKTSVTLPGTRRRSAESG